MSDLTEFDHAINAAFGEGLGDPVQNAWLDSTAYWTVWLGILCDMDMLWDESLDDEWDVPDETSCCDYHWPHENPGDSLITSTIEAGQALWHDGLVEDDRLDTMECERTWPPIHMRRWEALGRMHQNDAVFVPNRKHRYRVRCT